MTVKNYSEQGGDKWVVSGVLEITAEGVVVLDGVPLTRVVSQAKSSATTIADLKADFNALLTKLQTAGLMDKDHG